MFCSIPTLGPWGFIHTRNQTAHATFKGWCHFEVIEAVFAPILGIYTFVMIVEDEYQLTTSSPFFLSISIPNIGK